MILMAFAYFVVIMSAETADVAKCMEEKSKSMCKADKRREWEW